MCSLNNLCSVPFGFIEIFSNGDVYTCCKSYIKDGCIGNIFEQPFEEIINSDKAIQIRKNILNNDYSMCNLELCYPNTMPFSYQLNSNYCNVNYSEKINKINVIKFSYDLDCNIKCRSCRESIYRNSDEYIKKLNEKAKKYFLPIIKYADKVCLIGSGDPFASIHTRNFINMIVKEYPNIKFDLHTNGLLLNEKMLNELKIIDKLSCVQISIHAATKKTYDKIVLGGNFNKLIENLKFISELKKKSMVEDIHINFVVSKLNIGDAKDFVFMGKKYLAECFFWNLRDWGVSYAKTQMADKYDIYKTFSDEIFRSENSHLNSYIYNIVNDKYFIEDYFIDKINFLINENEKLHNSIYDINNKIDFYNTNSINIYNKIINSFSWWIPVRKWRENFRAKFKVRPDQTRPDQTRPDQTRPNNDM